MKLAGVCVSLMDMDSTCWYRLSARIPEKLVESDFLMTLAGILLDLTISVKPRYWGIIRLSGSVVATYAANLTFSE
jgi:hypothetical protein